jgi:hypothetical protein
VNSGAYVQIASGVTIQSYTVTDLIPGTVYSYIVNARNLVGFGGYSSSVSIMAASRPFTPVVPVTRMISNTNVNLTWTAPFDGGTPITSYIVKLRYSNGVTFGTQVNFCDGS